MGQCIGNMCHSFSNILLSILAILFPPAAALITVCCSRHFLLNILLTLLGWIPGVIHALWLIWRDKTY